MSLNRREALRKLCTGAVVVGTVALAEKAMAAPHNTDQYRTQEIPPRDHHGPTLRAQPPYRHSEAKHIARHKKSTHKHGHAKRKTRSLRAQATLDTPGNRRDMALTMWGEARGYGTLGMRCVGHVIMNRVKADKARFGGDTVSGVCRKVGKKYHQFSCWNEWDDNFKTMHKLPDMNEHNPDWIAFLKADKLAGQILAGIDKDNTAGATHYFADTMLARPYWIDDMEIIGVMFGHIFCKEKKHKTHTHTSHHKGATKHPTHSHSIHHRKKKTLRIKTKRKPLPMKHHAKETHTHLPIKPHKTVSRAHH